MCRIAMLSVHGCPLASLGAGEAGGLQLYVRALSQELGRRGMTIDVFTRRTDPNLPEVVAFGENARAIHVTAGPPAPIDKNDVFDHLPEFLYNVQRIRTAEGLEYQYVHSHYWLSGWVGKLLARRWNVPHVTMFHTLGKVKNHALSDASETSRRIEIEQKVAASADRIVVATDSERHALEEWYDAPRERISVIPCGVDLDRFRPQSREDAACQLGLEGQEVVLFVGRMDRVKGLDVLIRAMALLKDRPRLRLVVVGGSATGEIRHQSVALAQRLGLNGHVQFRGAVEQTLLPDYYSAADVCVIPSHYESFGLAAAEALACGTPVVASMVGGLPTIVRDGENGLLVPWRRPEEFARRIEQILDDHRLRDRLAANARRSVEAFGWGEIAEQIIDLYRSVAREREPALACACPS